MSKKTNLKRIISSVLISMLFTFFFTHPASAEEKTVGGAVLRSTVIPGWGQFYNEQRKKGWILLGTEALVGAGAIYYWMQSENAWDEHEDVYNKGDTAKADEYYDDYETNYDMSRTLTYVVAGIWLYNIFDAWKNARSSSEGLSIEINGAKEIKLAYKIRF